MASTAFIKGLLLETVLREDGTFRVKPDLLPDVAEIVVDHPASESIISDVTHAIRGAAPGNDEFILQYGVERLDAIKASVGDQAVRALADAARAFVQEEERGGADSG